MRPITALLLTSTLFLLPSCQEISGATNAPPRTGPDFEITFPDAAALVTTTDVQATRKKLDATPLPESQAHHDALINALDSVPEIDSEHLILLTEAVAIPPRLKDGTRAKSISVTTINGRVFVYSRGEGAFSHVIDDLLLAGAKKLSDIGPESFGRLISVTQKAETTVALSDILLEESDSGSTADLRIILKGIPFSTVRQELCTEVLLPRDRLKGERADVAIESMSFDSNRTALIGAIYDTLESLDPATLVRHTKLQSFDSGKIHVVEKGAKVLSSINGSDALKLVKTASFDSGRDAILKKLLPKLVLGDADEVLAFVRTNSFDSGRTACLKTLLGAKRFPDVSSVELVEYAKICSFDSGRSGALKLVAPHLRGGFTASSAANLLDVFSFDSGRMSVVRLFQRQLQELSERDRQSVLKEFSMSSDREAAANLLIR